MIQLVTLAERLVSNRTQSALAMAGRDDLSTRVSAMLDLRQSRGRAGSVCIAGAAVSAAVVIAAIAPLSAVAVARAALAAEARPIAPVGAAAAVFPAPPAPAAAREEVPEAGALERGSAPQAPGAAQLPSFQVASIRPSIPGRPASQRVTPTRLDYVSTSLRGLVATAFRIEFAYQLSAPAWLDEVRFDIQATYSPEARQQVRAMLQRLLVERFGLVAHDESGPSRLTS